MTIHTKRTRRGVVYGDQPDHERTYFATKRLHWNEGWIEAGEEVPFDRGGRNMANLVREGLVVEMPPAGRS